MLAWLPIVGSLLSGVSNMFSTWNQTKMAKDKNDLEEIKIRLANQRTDIRRQLQEDIIIFPVALWMGLYSWDKIVALKYPDMVWGVAPFGDYALMASVPIVVLAYLFGLPIRDKFK